MKRVTFVNSMCSKAGTFSARDDADQVFIDPTFFGIFVCVPLQSFVVNVCIEKH